MGLWPLHSQTHSLISTSVSDSADPGHDEDNASTTELTTLHSLSFSRTNLSGKLSHHDDEREALKRHKKGKTSTPSTLHVLSESSCEVTKLYRQHTAGPADSHESGSHGSHDLSYELRESESSGSEDTLPLTPTGMSPRQSRYKPRSYVSPDADDLYHTATDERCRDGRTDKPPGSSVEPAETDLLLGITHDVAINITDILPTPVTQCKPVNPPFSFSMIETFMHMLGISVTLALIVFSVYLTLSNVTM